jgi:alginate O-acetyltransferase complex protein AlgJ
MKKKWYNKLLVFGFILVLCLPLSKMLMDGKSGVLPGENRKGAVLPVFSLRSQSTPYASVLQYMQNLNDYFSDHIGYRSKLLGIFRFIKSSIFAVNPYPEKVIGGTDHWYFLGDSFEEVVKESKGIIWFSESQLNLIESNLKTIARDCNDRGINLYVAIAPNKHTVYGQYLPIIKSEHATKLEQVMMRLKNDHINFIDLKRDFAQCREKRLFHRNDTHWNSFGAFSGYSTLMDYIVQDYPENKVLSLNDFIPDTITSNKGDLTAMLSMNIMEKRVILKSNYVSNARKEKDKLNVPDYYFRNPDDYEIRYSNRDCPLKALIFRDSFFDELIPWLSDTFGESVFIWYQYQKNVVDVEKPDLIIYELIERDIDYLATSPV